MSNVAVTTMFDFNGLSIRIADQAGEPWFVAADVCRVLNISNPTTAILPLASSEKAKSFIGSANLANVISEYGLYKLILRANRSPAASPFQDWVTKAVLPSIRKTGGYVMGQEKVATGELSMAEMTVRVLEFQQALTAQLKADVAKLEQQVAVSSAS